MTAPPPALRIDRARLVHARGDDRARLEAALGFASPAATGVAERALLLIRRLRVDRPLGRIGTEAFASELVDRIRAARLTARHGQGGPDDDLYFEDEAALELAIVRAWLSGERLPSVIRETMADSAAPITRWRRRLLGDARLLPRVVAALHAAGLAAAWFERFDDGELVNAANMLLRGHGAEPIDADPDPAAETRHIRPAARHRPGRAEPISSAISEPIAIACGATTRPGVRMLLAISLVVLRRPELLTTIGFRASVSALVHGPRDERRQHIAALRPGVAPPDAAAPRPAEVAKRQGGMVRSGRSGPQPDDSPRTEPHGLSSPNEATAMPPAPMSRSPSFIDQFAPAPPMTSDYAGLFFLLNIFLVLGLYGDFTDPARQARGLSPFELLLLLGRRWFGRAFAADPIGPILRTLAGLAPREPVGRHFDAPSWSVPDDWLRPWPRHRARVVTSAGGVSRWHKTGFPIADRWCVPRAPGWLRRRWISGLARYLEARLARALGIEDMTAALAMVVRLRGTIAVDGDRVDVRFALNDHPLALRLAGLDRDPGWIPAAGRSIGFHFT